MLQALQSLVYWKPVAPTHHPPTRPAAQPSATCKQIQRTLCAQAASTAAAQRSNPRRLLWPPAPYIYNVAGTLPAPPRPACGADGTGHRRRWRRLRWRPPRLASPARCPLRRPSASWSCSRRPCCSACATWQVLGGRCGGGGGSGRAHAPCRALCCAMLCCSAALGHAACLPASVACSLGWRQDEAQGWGAEELPASRGTLPAPPLPHRCWSSVTGWRMRRPGRVWQRLRCWLVASQTPRSRPRPQPLQARSVCMLRPPCCSRLPLCGAPLDGRPHPLWQLLSPSGRPKNLPQPSPGQRHAAVRCCRGERGQGCSSGSAAGPPGRRSAATHGGAGRQQGATGMRRLRRLRHAIGRGGGRAAGPAACLLCRFAAAPARWGQGVRAGVTVGAPKGNRPCQASRTLPLCVKG